MAVALTFLFLAPGCPQQSGESAGDGGTLAEASPRAAPATLRRERPLPAYQGNDVDGGRISISELLGKRLLLFFFDPSAKQTGMVGKAVAGVAAERVSHNFDIVGVAMKGDRDGVKSVLRELGLEIPVLDDRSGGFANLLSLRAPVALLAADADGYVITGTTSFIDEVQDPSAMVEGEIRDWLRLPRKKMPAVSLLGERPRAPLFSATRLDGGEPFELAALRGTPLVLVFFMESCPHCKTALRFFEKELAELPEAQRPVLAGVSVVKRTIGIRERLEEEGLGFFPILLDPDGSIRSAYGAETAVPVIFLIDGDGSILSRTDGWRDRREPALMRMRLAKLAGEPLPILLHSTGYSGDEFCNVCHEAENQTWQLTRHAGAFDTLVRHGADHDPECLGCHVVGWGEPGGFSLENPAVSLEGVGCETCHGRGGTHLDEKPDDAPPLEPDYEAVCKTCHTQKHSLGFEYAKFLPLVSHEENLHVTELPVEERRRILGERSKPRQDLLPGFAEYTGSEVCKSCHEEEFATWSEHAHAASIAKLEAPTETENPECLRCHTTAFGKPGGFPADANPAELPDLAVVGCESCHGPGSKHVEDKGSDPGNIVALGDKSAPCVTLQVCASCHDEANDPGFAFRLEDEIEHQRHGIVAAGTGKRLDDPAATQEGDST
jgi:peroxiredoxin